MARELMWSRQMDKQFKLQILYLWSSPMIVLHICMQALILVQFKQGASGTDWVGHCQELNPNCPAHDCCTILPSYLCM
jgi:hypothetical protein